MSALLTTDHIGGTLPIAGNAHVIRADAKKRSATATGGSSSGFGCGLSLPDHVAISAAPSRAQEMLRAHREAASRLSSLPRHAHPASQPASLELPPAIVFLACACAQLRVRCCESILRVAAAARRHDALWRSHRALQDCARVLVFVSSSVLVSRWACASRTSTRAAAIAPRTPAPG